MSQSFEYDKIDSNNRSINEKLATNTFKSKNTIKSTNSTKVNSIEKIKENEFNNIKEIFIDDETSNMLNSKNKLTVHEHQITLATLGTLKGKDKLNMPCIKQNTLYSKTLTETQKKFINTNRSNFCPRRSRLKCQLPKLNIYQYLKTSRKGLDIDTMSMMSNFGTTKKSPSNSIGFKYHHKLHNTLKIIIDLHIINGE